MDNPDIQTIEDALADMGRALTQPAIADRAREAVSRGEVLEVTIQVRPEKQGAAVTMHSTMTSSKQSHGRLIRLD